MVNLRVEVDDWDTGESTELTLPCDVKNKVDTTHELQITDWQAEMSIGFYDDVQKLSELLDDINAETPSMTLEILEAILNASYCAELSDKEFVRKICSSDYMFEEITETNGSTIKEKCARFLANEMMIPFAQNINEGILEKISRMPDKVLWNKVWDYYDNMGFQIIEVDGKHYAFHWGDAETE